MRSVSKNASATLAEIQTAIESARAERQTRIEELPEAQRAAARSRLGGGPVSSAATLLRGRIAELDDVQAGLKQLAVLAESAELASAIEASSCRVAELESAYLVAREADMRSSSRGMPESDPESSAAQLYRAQDRLARERDQVCVALLRRLSELEREHGTLLGAAALHP